MQKAPWMDQNTKKMMKRWCRYQKRSKFARRGFSIEVITIMHNTMSMTQPDQPGPVMKLASRKPRKPRLFFAASCAKLLKWAIVWSQLKKKIDQATSLWKVIFLSNWMTPLSGV